MPNEIPFQITFIDFPESDAIWLAVQERIEKLTHYNDHIIKCEVTISCPHRHHHADRYYHVNVHIYLPRNEIVISRNPEKDEAQKDIYVAIRNAFDSAERVLKEKIRMRRNRVRQYIRLHQPSI
ncbi:MAG: hypothetical protein BroJett040_14570 [Oligoflexia bacterium]|nr:MAG: hypothetical protein BroJett040_14570 [Oligoflexia bacterium]